MSKATFDPTLYNPSNNLPFSTILDREISRRRVLKGGAGMTALGVFSGVSLLGCSDDDNNGGSGEEPKLTLGFNSIPGSKTHAVLVPEGYSAQVLAPWGTPLNSSAAAWKEDGSNSAQDQANAVGMHHDGMSFFPIDGSDSDGLLCINHEYVDQGALHPNGATIVNDKRSIAEEIRKEIYAHGVSVVRIVFQEGMWKVVENDPRNRRITGDSEMDIAGPLAAGHPLLITKYAPDGDVVRGTLNNCGSGESPWGTFLTCEENWPGYFVNTGTRSDSEARIGISTTANRYGWEHLAGDATETNDEFARYNVTATAASAAEDYRNEANGHGYVVEIDPYSGDSRPVKRTALGRFRHESVAYGKLTAGQPVTFYSGHDGRFEYLYKYVSDANWDPSDAQRSDRLAVGDKYLNQGTLYVAKFSEGGVGQWLPLTLASATSSGGTLGDIYNSQAELILDTIRAADALGATPMDRPEWIAVDPTNGVIYLALTNNTKRDTANAANPRVDNKFGHIIRWQEGSNVGSFDWEIFLFGSDDNDNANINRSGLGTLNQFASPDGLVFDNRGIMWVQTDNGAEEVTGYTNDQMLAVIPSKLVDENNNLEVVTADNQMELRRFFVGPNDSEVTGLAFTPDNKYFFANIQHPGNWPFSDDAAEETPTDVDVRPRAATVVISKNDGGEIGV